MTPTVRNQCRPFKTGASVAALTLLLGFTGAVAAGQITTQPADSAGCSQNRA